MMDLISQSPDKIQNNIFDAIIIGGGIYGVMLSLTASQAGLKTLLLEKNDFGSATSFNSLRIIHGGLRYLQNLDLNRFFESVSERKWLLKNFPGITEPLPCLMPLYGKGLYKPSVFRVALLINDILSFKRNKNISTDSQLPGGKIISSEEVKKIFPQVDDSNLKGGAVWYDGSMPNSHRIIIEALKWSCSLGSYALNYFEVTELLKDKKKVKGVKAYDKESKKIYEFNSNVIINAAGPWCRELAKNFDKDYKELFKNSIAWNVLFNKKSISDHALAVIPNKPNAKTYFIRPWKGMLLAGTVHEACNEKTKSSIPSEDSVNKFIEDLNSSVKNLNLKLEDILQIYSGFLPAKEEGSDILASKEKIIDHSKENGIEGLFSVSGVKFTTARLVAEKTIKMIFKNIDKIDTDRKEKSSLEYFDFLWDQDSLNPEEMENLKNIISSESVKHLDDLILRRTSLGDNPARAAALAGQVCSLFNWDNNQVEEEIKRLKDYYNLRNFNSMHFLEFSNKN